MTTGLPAPADDGAADHLPGRRLPAVELPASDGRLVRLDELPARSVVLVVPPFGVSTPWAYRRFDELPSVRPPLAQPGQFTTGQWPARELLSNDLERAVLPAYPLIAALKDALLHLGAEGVLMSGSGSSTFALFPNRNIAESVREPFRARLGAQNWMAVAAL